MAYTPPVVPNVDFNLETIYTPPVVPNVDFNLTDVATILQLSELQNKYDINPAILNLSELQNKYDINPAILHLSELQNEYVVRVSKLKLSELQSKYSVQDKKLETQLNAIYSLRFATQLDAIYGATIARQFEAKAFYSFSTQLDVIYTIRGDVAKQLDSIYDITNTSFIKAQLDSIYSMAQITKQLSGIYSIGPLITIQLDAKYLLSTTPVAKQLDSIYDIKVTNSVLKQLKCIYSILTTQIINITGQPTITLGNETFDISDADIGIDEGSFVWRAKIGILHIEDYVKFEINDEIIFNLYGEIFNLVVESKMLSRSGPAQIKMGIIAVSPAIKFDFPRADALDLSFTSDILANTAAQIGLGGLILDGDLIDEDFTIDPGWPQVGDSNVVDGEVISIILGGGIDNQSQSISLKTELWAICNLNVDEDFAIGTDGHECSIFSLDDGLEAAAVVKITISSGILQWKVSYDDDVGPNNFVISSPELVKGTNYIIVLHWKKATTVSSNDGIAEIWIQGNGVLTKILDVHNVDNNSVAPDKVRVGNGFANPSVSGTLRHDNVKVATKPGNLIDWDIPDWTIPANRLAIKDGSPIQLVKTIVEAAGGILESKPDGTLVARPLFPISLPDFDTSTVAQTYTDNSDNMSVSEKYSPTKRLNKFRILDISSQFRDTLEFEFDIITTPNDDTETSTTDGILKIFTSPFRETVKVQSSQESNVAFQLVGVTTKQLTEQVEFKEGFATLSRPIQTINKVVWEGQSLGSLTFTADDTKVFSASVVNLYGLATITYTTKFIKYIVHGQEGMNVQFRLEVNDG